MDIRLPLPAALRHRVQSEAHLWAHIVSLIVSPPLVWAIWAHLALLSFSEDPRASLPHASVFALAVCAAPMLFVVCMVRLGKIGDLHMRESRERIVPYSIAVALGIVSEIFFARVQADPLIRIVTLVSIVELGLILVGTFFCHISLHAMAMTSVISATCVVFGFSQCLLLLPLLLLVILARLVLQRHTPGQVLIGALIGLLTPLTVVAILGSFV